MKVAVIGGGFLGLSCAINLLDLGFEVDIYEQDNRLGGFAISFNPGNWQWELEKFYHHIFSNDNSIINLAKKVNVPIIFSRPKTMCYINNSKKRLDSPLSVLKFNDLNFFSRLKLGLGIVLLKLIYNGKFLERFTCESFLPHLMGKEGYQKIWLPLLTSKFSSYYNQVNMAWFWARIYKRTAKLGYFEKGFAGLVLAMANYIQTKGGLIFYNKKINEIKTEQRKRSKIILDEKSYDIAIITTPAPMIPKINKSVVIKFPKLEYLWGQTLILELKNKFMEGYWLNILKKNWPFLVLVEHTNFVDKKNYENYHIVYIGNYLENEDYRLKLSDEKLLDLYLPYLKQINSNFSKQQINNFYRFQTPYAQPVFKCNYSKEIPYYKTSLNGVYIANMSMVYPWDRGTNYAVEMAKEVTDQIVKDLRV